MIKKIFSAIIILKSLVWATESISLNEETLMYPDGSSIHITKTFYYDAKVGKVPHGKYVTYRKNGVMDSEIIYSHGTIIEKRNWNLKGYLIYERVSKGSSRITYHHSYYNNSKIKRRTQIQKMEIINHLTTNVDKPQLSATSKRKSTSSGHFKISGSYVEIWYDQNGEFVRKNEYRF